MGKRADLFSLGVIAYRALTGSPPFSGDTNVEILFRISHAMQLRPTQVTRLPEALDAVLSIALAKAPEDRFASGAELALALEAAVRGKLDPSLGAHSRALLAALPWGASRPPGG